MDADLIWLLVGLGLIVTEALVLTLVLLMFGAGALAASAVAFAGGPVVAQVAAFSVVSVGLLLLVRPPLKDALDLGGTSARTDPRALSGSSAVVVERVSEDGGQVRLNGELWRARPYAGGAPLEVGRVVSVAAVEGATVLVYSTDLS